MTDTLPDRFADAGTLSVGTFVKSGSPVVVEALGYTPLDFVVVDRQHASPGLETIESIARAADVVDVPVLVRLSSWDSDGLVNLLDSGVQGVIVPQVDGPEVARSVVARTRYDRRRSYATSTRTGRYGNRTKGEHLERTRKSTVVVAMIETQEGVESADAIASVEGITALMTGPADLALSLGVEAGSDEHESAIDRVFDVAADAGVGAGEYVSGAEDLGSDHSHRRSFAIYRSDVGALSGHFDDVLER